VNVDPRELAVRTWQTLEKRLAEAHPVLLERLPRGADLQALTHVEVELGVSLPPIVREIYLVHDGIGMSRAVDQYARTSYFLSLDDALHEWRLQEKCLQGGVFGDATVRETRGPVRAHWWNSRWFPIAATISGDLSCVDLDPDSGGLVGQIISWWHDFDDREVLAENLADFLIHHVEEDDWAVTAGLVAAPPPWRG
jgi:cell wall assembly regulator SMI1